MYVGWKTLLPLLWITANVKECRTIDDVSFPMTIRLEISFRSETESRTEQVM
jgi:hypothetical protein